MTVSWPHLLICGFHPNTKPFLWGASCVNYTPAIAEISSYVSILPCQAFVGAGDGGSCRACLERLRYMTFASCAHGCEKCLAQLACQVRWCELSDPFGGKAGSLWAELLQLIISRWIYRNEQKSPKDLQNDVNMLEIIYLNNIQIWQKTGMWERNDSLKKMDSASFWSSSRGCELLKSERLAGGQIVSNSP